MQELLILIGNLFSWLGWIWGPIVVAFAYVLCGVRTIRSGFRGVYYRFGRAVSEAHPRPWPHWRPFPFYRLEKLFCSEQVKDLTHGLQEVVTEDGITCRIEGGVTFEIVDAIKACTAVDDPDERMALEAMSQIREWVSTHTYEQCREEELGKKMMGNMRRAGKWGIKILDLSIVTFAPANTEARALVFLIHIAKLRAESAKIFIEAIKELKSEWEPLGINPSILLASIAGVQVSAVAPADQLNFIRNELANLKRHLDTDGQDEAHNWVSDFHEFLASRIPGGDMIGQKIAEVTSQ